MAPARTVVIAGAGIGGLTAALAIARQGFRVTVLEAAERLEEIGAGIQLSPNASRVLIALGLRERLEAARRRSEELTRDGWRSGREIVARAPLAGGWKQRYGAPFWLIHRGDLQAALRAAVAEGAPKSHSISASKVEDFARARQRRSALRRQARHASPGRARHRVDRRRRNLVKHRRAF